jgi:hypothetical protein
MLEVLIGSLGSAFLVLFHLSCVSSSIHGSERLVAPQTETPEETNVQPRQPGIPDLTPTILTIGKETHLEGSDFSAVLNDFAYQRARGPGKTEQVDAWADIEIRHVDGRSQRLSHWKFYEIQTVLGRRFSLRGNEDEVRLYLLPEAPVSEP